jgi:hypothetical protein
MGLVQSRCCSGDGTLPASPKRGLKYEFHKNGIRWPQMATFRGSFVPSRSARRRPGAEALFGWAELRSLERNPLICQALCRLIPSVTSQPPALDRGCRIADLTVKITRRRRVPVPAGGADHLFRDIKSPRGRLFIPTTSLRRRGRPNARSPVGHRKTTVWAPPPAVGDGGRRGAQQKPGDADRAQRCGQG